MKKNIFLDLDNTIISSEKIKDNENIDEMAGRAIFFEYVKMGNHYLICERPNLQPFLDFLFENYNVHVWTAASKDYGIFIIKNFITKHYPNRQIKTFLFDHHCKLSQKILNSPKSLEMLWSEWNLPFLNSTNTLIIDDLTEVYRAQPNNCIHIKPFEFMNVGSEKDTELIKTKRLIKSFF